MKILFLYFFSWVHVIAQRVGHFFKSPPNAVAFNDTDKQEIIVKGVELGLDRLKEQLLFTQQRNLFLEQKVQEGDQELEKWQNYGELLESAIIEAGGKIFNGKVLIPTDKVKHPEVLN